MKTHLTWVWTNRKRTLTAVCRECSCGSDRHMPVNPRQASKTPTCKACQRVLAAEVTERLRT